MENRQKNKLPVKANNGENTKLNGGGGGKKDSVQAKTQYETNIKNTNQKATKDIKKNMVGVIVAVFNSSGDLTLLGI